MKITMPNPRPFYVTAIDGRRVYFLAGPFNTLEDAERMVEPVRAFACDHRKNRSAGRAHFMAFGVTRTSDQRRTKLGTELP